jgi:hypothetical protein
MAEHCMIRPFTLLKASSASNHSVLLEPFFKE